MIQCVGCWLYFTLRELDHHLRCPGDLNPQIFYPDDP